MNTWEMNTITSALQSRAIHVITAVNMQLICFLQSRGYSCMLTAVQMLHMWLLSQEAAYVNTVLQSRGYEATHVPTAVKILHTAAVKMHPMCLPQSRGYRSQDTSHYSSQKATYVLTAVKRLQTCWQRQENTLVLTAVRRPHIYFLESRGYTCKRMTISWD
jgi:hypothetical protein